MKEIKMPYSEYEEMVETIKTQEGLINTLKSDCKVVLIKDRLSRFGHDVIEIVTTDPELAEKYLKHDFDRAARHIFELEGKLTSTKKELYRYEINEKESGWKAFLNFYPNKKYLSKSL